MEQWRALADALVYAMTETGVDPDTDLVQHVAKDAANWLNSRGLSIVEDAQVASEAHDMQVLIAALVSRCGGKVELSDRELAEAKGQIRTWRNMRYSMTGVELEVD